MAGPRGRGFCLPSPKRRAGGGVAIKFQPLTILSRFYRIWAGIRIEDAMVW